MQAYNFKTDVFFLSFLKSNLRLSNSIFYYKCPIYSDISLVINRDVTFIGRTASPTPGCKIMFRVCSDKQK
ncbi:hypothetical protein ANAPC5_01496 [Anaplasma phagocytophilum]|nr:hypothetical protein ANAPC5_01496 [Anaplasma phagocytophilum]